MRARYYDPATAQFLTRDPLATSGQAPYGYAAGSPLNATDPSGHCPMCLFAVGAIGGAIGGAVYYGLTCGDNCNWADAGTTVVKGSYIGATLGMGAGLLGEAAGAGTGAAAAARGGVIRYGALDGFGRATGITALITRAMIGTGTRASVDPAGWASLAGIFRARGHLLARVLGGLGNEPRNLVAIPQAMNRVMEDYELMVRDAVLGGQTVLYRVTPNYGYWFNEAVPTSIKIQAIGSRGFMLDVTIFNR